MDIIRKNRPVIPLKSRFDIEHLRLSCRMVSEILKSLESEIRPGVTTLELDRLAENLIRERDGRAAPPEVGFPGNICVSINDEVVHGVPSDRVLRIGDLVSIDVTAAFDGYYGDIAATYPVGKISAKAEKLLEVTKNALYVGISSAFDGKRLGDISNTIQTYVESHGFSVVRDFVGHGIGKNMWEEPKIPNFGIPDRGPRLKEGMVLAIEPMVNVGDYKVKILDDGWTAVTEDGSLSAHFEHTVAITNGGPEILTNF